VQAWVGLGDPGELDLLAVGEVLGVLPQRVAGALETLGTVEAGRAGASRRGDRAGARARPGRPCGRRSMPRRTASSASVAQRTTWNASAQSTAFGQRSATTTRSSPRHRRTHVVIAALRSCAEDVEEGPQRGPVPTLGAPTPAGRCRGPRRPSGSGGRAGRRSRRSRSVQPRQPVDRAAGVGPHPGDDRPDRAPRDPHQPVTAVFEVTVASHATVSSKSWV
jgi:hypothetical protein